MKPLLIHTLGLLFFGTLALGKSVTDPGALSDAFEERDMAFLVRAFRYYHRAGIEDAALVERTMGEFLALSRAGTRNEAWVPAAVLWVSDLSSPPSGWSRVLEEIILSPSTDGELLNVAQARLARMDAELAIQASVYRLFSIGSPEVSRHLVKGLVEIAGKDPLLGPRIASTLQLAAEDGVSTKIIVEGLRELEKTGTPTAEPLQTILDRQASQSEPRPTIFCPVVFKVVGDF